MSIARSEVNVRFDEVATAAMPRLVARMMVKYPTRRVDEQLLLARLGCWYYTMRHYSKVQAAALASEVFMAETTIDNFHHRMKVLTQLEERVWNWFDQITTEEVAS